ncbi:MAG: SAM-dependent methyltransferase [Verrucomicrobiales bacterium]|jgi:SAM-dependent methyltransferase
MATAEDIHEANRRSWNHATARHSAHKGDQATFIKEGGNTLFPEEMDLLGDLTGKSLVHLLCNSGQDTLSIAKHLGAHVLGVDISDEAITAAGTLSKESGIEGKFMRSDIYAWFDQPSLPSVDVVFASYGALLWLSDLKRWGQGVSKILKPGGRIVIIEFHPMFDIFDDEGKWTAAFDYMGGAMVEELEGAGDCVRVSGAGLGANPEISAKANIPYENPHPTYSFSWGLAERVMALVGAGLQMTHLQEYPYCNGWKAFPEMVEKPGRRLYLPSHMPQLPLMYSLVCEKPLS